MSRVRVAALACSVVGAPLVAILAPPAAAAFPGVNGRIAFADHGIGIVNPDGRGVVDLTTAADDGSPAWSPTGARIAFVRTTSGDADVWVMDADGSDPRNVTSGSAGDDRAPTW